MYAIVLLIASVFALLGIGQASRSVPAPAAANQAAVRREETESKAMLSAERRTAGDPRPAGYLLPGRPRPPRAVDRLGFEPDLSGGRAWAVSKAEYDYWRDMR
jgi:hypothetical protein